MRYSPFPSTFLLILLKMNNLLRFIQRFNHIVLFVLLFVLSVWLYIDTSYYQKAQFSRFAGRITAGVMSRVANVGQYVKLKETNVALSQENIALKNELERCKNVLQRGGLTVKVDSLSDRAYTYTPARVVKNSVGRRQNYITLNIGSNSGVIEGAGVVCANGVVGIVASVSPNFASVISLLNTSIKISVRHKKSGAFGSLVWDGENYREMLLTDIPLHVQLALGDTIATSGFSALFPRDIDIGSIVDFETNEGNVYSIEVQLFADFKRLDYVYVVNSTDYQERTQLEQQNHDKGDF